jgi:hypothetical protein
MDEHAWLSCVDPDAMLAYLLAQRASRRKLRLLACALVRRWWRALHEDPRIQQAVIASERYADHGLSRGGLRDAANAARSAAGEAPQFEASAYNAAVAAAEDNPRESLPNVLRLLQQMARWEAAYECVPGMNETNIVTEAMNAERAAQCVVFRELFGNPFRHLPLDDAWLSWNDGCIPKMVQAVRNEQRFHELPILADALMDAGCQHGPLLAHLHSPGPHHLGCWALDALLRRR